MNERIINETGSEIARLWEPPKWVVLSEDMREVVYRGTSFEECLRYLRSICPNGKCEN